MKTKAFFFLTALLITLSSVTSIVWIAKTEKNNLGADLQVSKNFAIPSKLKDLPVVEPHLSAHPIDKDHLLAAAMIVTEKDQPYESCRLSTFISNDGGKNWEETTLDYWGYDPWTAILPNGQTALSWLGTPGSFQHQFPIQFFQSDNGGKTWNQQAQTSQAAHGHDGTKIISHRNDFYFTTVRFNGDMSADVVLYHRKDQEAFQEVAKIDGQGVRLNFCEPAVLSDGTVVVPASHFLRKTWVQRYDPRSKTFSEKHMVTTRPGGARGYMRLAADTSTISPFQDRIYFVRALGSKGQYEGIWLNYSKDGGKNWSRDIRIDSFDTQLPSKAQVASLAINKKGVLAISWVDSQEDPEQKKNDVYFSFSKDGSQSFSPPVRVTDVSSDPRTEQNGDVANKFPAGGHYLNMVAKANDSFQLIWSDSRSGIFELQTCQVSVR